jgi:hypothetical protein
MGNIQEKTYHLKGHNDVVYDFPAKSPICRIKLALVGDGSMNYLTAIKARKINITFQRLSSKAE